MNTKATGPEVEPEGQESYIVSEGKKRGSTRDVRPEAATLTALVTYKVTQGTPSVLELDVPGKLRRRLDRTPNLITLGRCPDHFTVCLKIWINCSHCLTTSY